jgi:hypothetical protein
MVVRQKVQQEAGRIEDVDDLFFYSFIVQKYSQAFAIRFAVACIDLYHPGASEASAT